MPVGALIVARYVESSWVMYWGHHMPGTSVMTSFRFGLRSNAPPSVIHGMARIPHIVTNSNNATTRPTGPE